MLTYKRIGIVHSPFKDTSNVPIQAVAAKGTKGKVEVFDEYIAGLRDIEGFSHIIHKSKRGCHHSASAGILPGVLFERELPS